MTPLKPLVALGAATVLSLSLAACGGGGSDAPKSASKADFCAAFNSGGDAFDNIGESDYSAASDAMHKMADKLQSVGTPSDTPADAREGFEIMIDAIGKVDADSLKSTMEDMKEHMSTGDVSEDDAVAKMFGVSADDMTKVEAFNTWAQKEC